MVFFVLGVGAVGALLGFLIGVSSTPVAGIGVTSLFAIVASGVALVAQGKVADPGSSIALPKAAALSQRVTVSSLSLLGKVLLLFTVTFTSGMSGGIWMRLSHAERSVPFPWPASKPPATLQSMLYWIDAAAYLRQAGHTEEQISAFYDAAQVASAAASSALQHAPVPAARDTAVAGRSAPVAASTPVRAARASMPRPPPVVASAVASPVASAASTPTPAGPAIPEPRVAQASREPEPLLSSPPAESLPPVPEREVVPPKKSPFLVNPP